MKIQSYNRKGSYEVRTKSGKVVGSFRTKLQAGKGLCQLKFYHFEDLEIIPTEKRGLLSLGHKSSKEESQEIKEPQKEKSFWDKW